jgi:hypothetical protein
MPPTIWTTCRVTRGHVAASTNTAESSWRIDETQKRHIRQAIPGKSVLKSLPDKEFAINALRHHPMA